MQQCDQRHQIGPGHRQVRLAQKLALARRLGLALEFTLAKVHLLHAVTVSLRIKGRGLEFFLRQPGCTESAVYVSHRSFWNVAY